MASSIHLIWDARDGVAADKVAIIVTRFDAAALLAALDAATERLTAAVDEVNALNVYPVPDGDTGTNMLHTMRSAVEHARRAERTIPAILAGAAHGALMGARGNSGVILSQVIKGLRDAATDETVDLRKAFAMARTCAYAAVSVPAAGTMLTYLKDVDAVVARSAETGRRLLRVAVDAGVAAVQRTRDENPVNRQAGVVDAGAQGLWYLMDGVLASLEGRAVPTTGNGLPRASAAPAAVAPATAAADLPPSWIGAYDVQCLIKAPSRPVEEIRTEMLEFGADCVLVVGDETVVKIHVHTKAPHEILRIAVSAGRIADVVVEDLEEMSAEHEAATGIVVPPPRERSALGVVAVVPGAGIARIAESLGAVVVHGGASMNPSTEELLAAIAATNADRVVVLPNDKNVILAAQSAAKLATDRIGGVTVIPTRNLAQGMAALASFDAGRDPAEAVEAMRHATEGAHSIEVTRATRDATVDGARVVKGEHIALVDGNLVVHGDDEAAAVGQAANALASAGLLTVYVGAGVDDERREAAVARLRAACPGAEVEVVDGGQPHYPFVIAAE